MEGVKTIKVTITVISCMWQFYIIRCLTFAHHSTEMQMAQVDTGPTASKRYYVRETRFRVKET